MVRSIYWWWKISVFSVHTVFVTTNFTDVWRAFTHNPRVPVVGCIRRRLIQLAISISMFFGFDASSKTGKTEKNSEIPNLTAIIVLSGNSSGMISSLSKWFFVIVRLIGTYLFVMLIYYNYTVFLRCVNFGCLNVETFEGSRRGGPFFHFYCLCGPVVNAWTEKGVSESGIVYRSNFFKCAH